MVAMVANSPFSDTAKAQIFLVRVGSDPITRIHCFSTRIHCIFHCIYTNHLHMIPMEIR